jgi:hypothetical protein
MSVTVVIPTRGEFGGLRRTVEHHLEGSLRAGADAEVIVVVGGGRRPTALDGLDTPRLRVLQLDGQNVARARNMGIAAARHDTVLFSDDDGVLAPTWWTDLAHALRDPAYPVVTAPVRVPVIGPVTAFLNYQRVFDAPPVDLDEAATVTGHCGLRRDRVPSGVRYDEENLSQVGEDVGFGYALRAAGVRIRWLADLPPGLHQLPDRIEEVTERAFRYGRGGAVLSGIHAAPVVGPADVLRLYRLLGTDDQRYRRFPEILEPHARVAFTVNDYLYNVAYALGYLVQLGADLGRAFVDVDLDSLRRCWREMGLLVAAETGHLGVADWAALPIDLARLPSGQRTPDPLIAEIRRGLNRYAPLVDAPPKPPGTTNNGHLAGMAGARDFGRLHASWSQLRGAGTAMSVDAMDRYARRAGFGFREACATVELAALRRIVGPARSGAAIAPAVAGQEGTARHG